MILNFIGGMDKGRVETTSKNMVRGKRQKTGLYFSVLLFTCFISLGLLFNPKPVHADITTNLLNYWSFDDATGLTAVDSAGGANGTLLNFPGDNSQWVAGHLNGALNFSSTTTNSVTATVADTNYLGALTISVWANITTGSGFRHFVSKGSGDGSTRTPFEFRTNNAATPTLVFARSNNTILCSFSGPAVTLNTLTHYAVVASADISVAPTFYINGVATTGTGSCATSGAPTGNSASIYIGRRPDGAVKMNGPLDELRIYNRALSSLDVTTLYTGVEVSTPTVTVQAASSVTSISATLNGNITVDGNASPTVRGFNYGLTSSYGSTTSTSGTYSTGAYTASLTGLICGTVYHYQAYATNLAGTGTSADQTFSTSACSVDTPINWWKFDDASGLTAVDSTGGVNGTLTNFPGDNSQWVAGQISGALDFNTTDYVTAAVSDSNYLGATTIAVWAKIDTGGGFREFVTKNANDSSTRTPFEFRTNNAATPTLVFTRANDSTLCNYNGPSVNLNAWAHYVVVAGANVNVPPTFYVNGVATTGVDAGSCSISGAPTGTNANIRIGLRPDNVVKMDGSMDDMRIFNWSLSSQNVTDLYNEGFPINAFPTTVNMNITGNVITLSGTGTSWTAGTPGTPTFTLSGGTGASITSQTITDATHATITLNAGSATGALTITDPSTSATTSVTVVHSYATTAVTDSNWKFSPYGWYSNGNGSLGANNIVGNSTYAQAVNPGAYFKVNFTGTTVKLAVDTSSLAGVAKQLPRIRYSIDGGATVDYQLLSGDTQITLGQNLSLTTHTLVVWFLSSDAYISRWNGHTSLKITGLVLDEGFSTSAPTLLTKRLLVFGDSITEGAWILGDHTDLTNYSNYEESVSSYSYGLASDLNAEYGNIAFGGQSWETAFNADIPLFPSAWNYYYSTNSRLVSGLFSPVPDYIVVNMGTNGGLSSASVVTNWLTLLRTAAGSSAKIFVLIPFNQGGLANITSGFNSYISGSSDANAFLINLGSNGVTYSTTIPTYSYDGLHPNVAGHAQLRTLVASGIQSAIATNPTISVTNSPVTYNASPQSATVSGSVAGTVSNIQYNSTATVPTDVGTYAITADFAPTDSVIYNSLTGASAGNFTISTASQSALTFTGQTVTSPAAFASLSTTGGSGTGAVTYAVTTAGTAGCSISGTTLSYTTDGTCGVTATRAADSNYNSVSSSEATFTVNPIPTHTITASSGSNGSITPSGAVSVNEGSDQVFTITPISGYHIDTVTVDSVAVSASSPYTFTNVTTDHTISATFAVDPVSATTSSGGHPIPVSIKTNTLVPTVNNISNKIYYNFGTTTLKNGSRGIAVKELQRFLNANLKTNLKIDGILGRNTIAIIKKWQKSHGLVADGLIGAKTKAMMNASGN